MRGRRPGSIVALAAAVLLGGCGADDPEGATEGERVPPESYVSDLCGAITTWMDDVQALNEELQDQLDPTSLDVVKDTTLAFLDDVIAATDRMLSDVQAAGVPDVADGGEAARGVSTALGDVREALAGARDRVEGLSNDDPEAFGSELETIGEDLRDSLEDTTSTLESFEVPELEEAADDVPACDQLAA